MKRTEYRAKDETIKSAPVRPSNGQLYRRPKPNPFTEDWCEGYDDGLAGIDGVLGNRDPADYWDGHRSGLIEREELTHSGSSNS